MCCGVCRLMVGKVAAYGCLLIAGHSEHVAESSTGVDDGLAGLFWLDTTRNVLDDVGARNNLRSANSSDIRTAAGKATVLMLELTQWCIDLFRLTLG